MLLIALVLSPVLLVALAAAVVPARQMKFAALGIALLNLALAIACAAAFPWGQDPSAAGAVEMFGKAGVSDFNNNLRVSIPWPLLEQFQISLTLGVDHLAMLMVLLTSALGVFAVLCSFSAIEHREKEFYFHLLTLQTGILGTFCALDFLLFYIAWELMMIPLYFLIGIWGSKDRLYATLKFVLYTLVGSLMMLLSILWMYYNGVQTYSYEVLLDAVRNDGLFREALWPYLGFFLAFAIKVPLWPLHTWLPDAHTEAPTAGSVVLAGVLLKTGVFGLLRYAIPLFPDAAVATAPVVIWLSIIAIIYGAMTAMVQTDMKRLVAYSSVSHMGFIMLGVYSFNAQGVNGAIIQMINHGISTGGLFLAVGMIYERRHTRKMAEFGGLAHRLPIFAALTMVMVLSSVGLPGLNGFVGEFPILIGAMQAEPILQVARDSSSWAAAVGMTNYTWLVAALAASGVILGAVYLLVMYQATFFGPLDNDENKELSDLNPREWGQLAVLSIAAVVLGLFPNLIFKPANYSSQPVLQAVARPLGLNYDVANTPMGFHLKAGHDSHGADGHDHSGDDHEAHDHAPADHGTPTDAHGHEDKAEAPAASH